MGSELHFYIHMKPGERVETDLTLPPDSGAILTGVVRRADGRPVSDAVVLALDGGAGEPGAALAPRPRTRRRKGGCFPGLGRKYCGFCRRFFLGSRRGALRPLNFYPTFISPFPSVKCAAKKLAGIVAEPAFPPLSVHRQNLLKQGVVFCGPFPVCM